MAYNEFGILKKTIQMIDDERNDIYIHIDKKVQFFDFEEFSKIPQKSNLFFTDRVSVYWGDYSQVECEYVLFKTAVQKQYDYYHLLSGVDMPLVSQDVIHGYFEEHNGEEFVSFSDHVNIDRLQYYHFYTRWARSDKKILRYAYSILHPISVRIQRMLRVNRLKNLELNIRKGSNWISVTNTFLEYILSKESFIRQLCKFSSCSDELFVQTLIDNSEFKSRCRKCMRYTDWTRGRPYTFREEDFEVLINSGCFWARKISEDVSGQLPDMLFKYVMASGK